jgi:hypothetical protein
LEKRERERERGSFANSDAGDRRPERAAAAAKSDRESYSGSAVVW